MSSYKFRSSSDACLRALSDDDDDDDDDDEQGYGAHKKGKGKHGIGGLATADLCRHAFSLSGAI